MIQHRARWPLGTRFIDTDRRKFRVIKVTFGDPVTNIGYSIEYDDGVIESQCGDHPQTQVGFINEADPHTPITQPVTVMDNLLNTGHLKTL